MKTGIAIDAAGQKIGTATMQRPDDGIHVTLSVLQASVRQPVRIVWDTLAPGILDRAGVVIATPTKIGL